MAFTIDKTGNISRLSKRLKEAPHAITEKVQEIINQSVITIEQNARARAPLGETGKLKASVYSMPYNMSRGAEVGARIFYSPFVEFGTGNNFQIPAYRNLSMNKLEAYAQTFKRDSGNLVNLPNRPFLFNSASEELYQMVNRIKKIKI